MSSLRKREHPNRALREKKDYLKSCGKGEKEFFFETALDWYHFLTEVAKRFLKTFNLYEKARREALSLQVVETEITLSTLPKSFDGFKILHLSDMHIDCHPRLHEEILSNVKGLSYDIAVLTGDYRFLIWGQVEVAHRYLSRLMEKLVIKSPVYGILGNHDIFETAEYLETLGVKMLINEGLSIKRGEDSIYLAGVDTKIYYKASDIKEALKNRKEDFSILLAHSPCQYKEALENRQHLYLCGHTHGGQLCLPGGVPIVSHTTAPRYMTKGLWNYKGMKGYTNIGVGASGIFARLNAIPEIAVLTLKKL